MNKKVFVKLIALLMAAAMLLGVCACSATDNNPTIGKIGKVKIKLSQYRTPEEDIIIALNVSHNLAPSLLRVRYVS